MTGMYEKRHGVILPVAVDGHDDPTGQALADMDLAHKREEAAEGGCYALESDKFKKAVEDLRKEKEGRRLDRRVFESVVSEFMDVRDARAGELILNGKTLAQAEADTFVRQMDQAIARGKGALQA